MADHIITNNIRLLHTEKQLTKRSIKTNKSVLKCIDYDLLNTNKYLV